MRPGSSFQGDPRNISFFIRAKYLDFYSSERSSISFASPTSASNARVPSRDNSAGHLPMFQSKTELQATAQILDSIQGLTLPRVKLCEGSLTQGEVPQTGHVEDDHKSEYEHHTQGLHSISLLSRGQELKSLSH